MRPLPLLLLATLATVSACDAHPESASVEAAASRGPAPKLLDVNDVSMLFPLPKKVKDVNKLMRLDAPAAGSAPLITPAMFATALAFAHPEDDSRFAFGAIKDWRVVGLRVDPCNKVSVASAECLAQVRLVAQPIDVSDGISAADHAMHLVYELPKTAAKTLVQDIVALKALTADAPTSGVPLGIHPTMTKQGLDGAYAKALQKLILKYGTPANLKHVAVLITVNTGVWRFVKGDVAGQELKQIQIPNMATGTRMAVLNGSTGTIGNFLSSVEPLALPGTDNINEIVDSNPFHGSTDSPLAGKFFSLPAAQQAAAVNAALRLDNPDVHTFDSVDCVSCHVATRALARAKGRAFLSKADGNPNRFKIPAGLSGGLPTADQPGNPSADSAYATRAFGYDGTNATIVRHTVNSSAKVANFINQTVIIGK